jgi:hypothetical protein
MNLYLVYHMHCTLCIYLLAHARFVNKNNTIRSVCVPIVQHGYPVIRSNLRHHRYTQNHV